MGGVVSARLDRGGYGFYFWRYEITTRFMAEKMRVGGNGNEGDGNAVQEAAKVLLCGGIAGVVTWASIFPLDVIKTRVQTQGQPQSHPITAEGGPLLAGEATTRRLGAIAIARNAYRAEGAGVFFKGLGICSLRAFIVNAAQWAVYEWIMRELDQTRKVRALEKGDDVRLLE